MTWKKAWSLLKETSIKWSEDNAQSLAAALSFYTLFSAAPLLIIAMAIAGLLFNQADTQWYIFNQLKASVGEDTAEAIFIMIKNTFGPSANASATIIGLATLLFGATVVFGQLQDALNAIWGVKIKPGRLIITIIKERLLSFLMILGVGFLLLLSLLTSTGLAALDDYLYGRFDGLQILLYSLDFVLSLVVTTLLFAMIFKILPDVKLKWSDVWVGAVVTAALFSIGKIFIGIYLGRESVASAYGAAGSLVVLLIWVYYSAQILFFGAELTYVYTTKYGSNHPPTENSEPIAVIPK